MSVIPALVLLLVGGFALAVALVRRHHAWLATAVIVSAFGGATAAAFHFGWRWTAFVLGAITALSVIICALNLLWILLMAAVERSGHAWGAAKAAGERDFLARTTPAENPLSNGKETEAATEICTRCAGTGEWRSHEGVDGLCYACAGTGRRPPRAPDL